MMTIFFPLVLIGVLFDLSLVGLSKVLEKLGHKWTTVKDLDTEDYKDGYCLVASPVTCIVYLNKEKGEARAIKLFGRS